ncbi:MAG: hypothetical protein K6G08_07700 [Prevotella sp.]|nr:hypothetical protein [Prevotella sp.]
MDKKKMLSPHFSLAEMTRTSTGLKNVPNEAQVKNLAYLCRWLEMLRDEWNKRYGDGDDPIIISSAYRSAAVNRAVGGASTSNHITGCAADIRCAGIEQAIRYTTILLDISDESQEAFDELIIEHRGVTWWVHFAVRPQNNRRKVLILQK